MSTTPSSKPDAITLAVLLSGGGTTLQNLIDRIADGRLNARIGVVIASRPDAFGLERARTAGLPAYVVARREFADVAAFSGRIFELCRQHGATLVCLAGWLQLLDVPEHWTGRVINIHPALLPKFGGRGMYGRHVHAAVITAGEHESGCTVHFVNNEYDAGPVILKQTCVVAADDTPDSLASRVFGLECEAYPEAIELIASGRVRLQGNHVVRT